MHLKPESEPAYGQVSRKIKASISFLFRWSLRPVSLVTLSSSPVAHYFDQRRVSPHSRRFEESRDSYDTNSTLHPLLFLFYLYTPDARNHRLKPEDSTFGAPDAKNQLWHSRENETERERERKREEERESSERSSTCANCGERSPEWGMLRRHCVKATTSTTWPDGWERYDGTGAARNFLDNIGRSGRATGANADAYVSGGATRIRAVGACPSRSPPASRRRRTGHPLS